MKAAETDASRLQAHIASTYVNLRLGIGIIGAVLPWLLWLGGRIRDREPLRSSMSAYYYSLTMGDVFVGSLFAIGVFLYLYKGFSTKENWALNLAGAFAIGVALIPTNAPGETAGDVTWHGTLAVLFFVCIAYVCIFRASDTLSLIRNTRDAKRLRALYRSFGIGMLISPIIAAVLSSALKATSLKFFLEAVAVQMFAAYWLVKTGELRATNAERLALEAKLQATSVSEGVQFRLPGRLVQLEP